MGSRRTGSQLIENLNCMKAYPLSDKVSLTIAGNTAVHFVFAEGFIQDTALALHSQRSSSHPNFSLNFTWGRTYSSFLSLCKNLVIDYKTCHLPTVAEPIFTPLDITS